MGLNFIAVERVRQERLPVSLAYDWPIEPTLRIQP